MQVYSRFRCISGLSPKQVASVIFRQFLIKKTPSKLQPQRETQGPFPLFSLGTGGCGERRRKHSGKTCICPEQGNRKDYLVFILPNDFTCRETRLHNADWFNRMITLGSIQRYAV